MATHRTAAAAAHRLMQPLSPPGIGDPEKKPCACCDPPTRACRSCCANFWSWGWKLIVIVCVLICTAVAININVSVNRLSEPGLEIAWRVNHWSRDADVLWPSAMSTANLTLEAVSSVVQSEPEKVKANVMSILGNTSAIAHAVRDKLPQWLPHITKALNTAATLDPQRIDRIMSVLHMVMGQVAQGNLTRSMLVSTDLMQSVFSYLDFWDTNGAASVSMAVMRNAWAGSAPSPEPVLAAAKKTPRKRAVHIEERDTARKLEL